MAYKVHQMVADSVTDTDTEILIILTLCISHNLVPNISPTNQTLPCLHLQKPCQLKTFSHPSATTSSTKFSTISNTIHVTALASLPSALVSHLSFSIPAPRITAPTPSLPISSPAPPPPPPPPLSTPSPHIPCNDSNDIASVAASVAPAWSLFDDLYYDTVCNPSEESEPQEDNSVQNDTVSEGVELNGCNKRRKICVSRSPHLASGVWNLSREQGSKLLGRHFRDDVLYICDWPGCVHVEEERKYMVFRGMFEDFKRTRVWRTINDGNRKKVDLGCAFCSCDETWDLHSAFCLRRGFGYHDDGEPVVRAFVCENGHVSGAWTDVPMYT